MPVIYTDLQDKIVLLTGVGQAPQEYDKEIWGNGAATAKVLAQSGAKIFGCDLDMASAELTKKCVEEQVKGARIDVVKADVTKRDEVVELVKKCMDKHGRIDVLVCNVGKSAPGGPAEMSDEVSWKASLTGVRTEHTVGMAESARRQSHFGIPMYWASASDHGKAEIGVGNIIIVGGRERVSSRLTQGMVWRSCNRVDRGQVRRQVARWLFHNKVGYRQHGPNHWLPLCTAWHSCQRRCTRPDPYSARRPPSV